MATFPALTLFLLLVATCLPSVLLYPSSRTDDAGNHGNNTGEEGVQVPEVEERSQTIMKLTVTKTETDEKPCSGKLPQNKLPGSKGILHLTVENLGNSENCTKCSSSLGTKQPQETQLVGVDISTGGNQTQENQQAGSYGVGAGMIKKEWKVTLVGKKNKRKFVCLCIKIDGNGTQDTQQGTGSSGHGAGMFQQEWNVTFVDNNSALTIVDVSAGGNGTQDNLELAGGHLGYGNYGTGMLTDKVKVSTWSGGSYPEAQWYGTFKGQGKDSGGSYSGYAPFGTFKGQGQASGGAEGSGQGIGAFTGGKGQVSAASWGSGQGTGTLAGGKEQASAGSWGSLSTHGKGKVSGASAGSGQGTGTLTGGKGQACAGSVGSQTFTGLGGISSASAGRHKQVNVTGNHTIIDPQHKKEGEKQKGKINSKPNCTSP